MSWWGYVDRIAATPRQRDITDVSHVDATEVSRWKKGKTPSPRDVAAFARGYKRPVLEAFVAAGFLTELEARVRPAAAPDLTQLTNDELLELVRARMREEGDLGGDTAATSPVTPGSTDDTAESIGQQYGKAAKKGASRGRQAREAQDRDALGESS